MKMDKQWNHKDRVGWFLFLVKLQEAVEKEQYRVEYFLEDCWNNLYWTGPKKVKIVAYTGNSFFRDDGIQEYEHLVLEMDEVPEHVIMEILYEQYETIYNLASEKLLEYHEKKLKRENPKV